MRECKEDISMEAMGNIFHFSSGPHWAREYLTAIQDCLLIA
jgi:hypothetical protein